MRSEVVNIVVLDCVVGFHAAILLNLWHRVLAIKVAAILHHLLVDNRILWLVDQSSIIRRNVVLLQIGIDILSVLRQIGGQPVL